LENAIVADIVKEELVSGNEVAIEAWRGLGRRLGMLDFLKTSKRSNKWMGISAYKPIWHSMVKRARTHG